ncbi:glycosyltransferase family 4 protein [Chamaesiphon minutus]|uniref:Glycosyltransferase n=1 Tax=Chamaesiphon minutus (strain ATCC 27169 / PCC 6605) TaxID=1173020 RepID=K9UBJ9_CHAP6|nr:glycosyltransferase family 4 protein [Chamaesiphon minutus]AFY91599.1 glycosyltransferase [Chamaesiphon minutus PCC 6605]
MSKLRVLLTIDEASLGGGQTHVLLLSKYLDRENFEVEVATEETGWLVDEVRKLGKIVHPITIANKLSWKSYQSIRQLLLAHRFDIVHTHGGTAGFWMRLVALGLTERPTMVHTYHGLHYLHISRGAIGVILQLFKRAIFRLLDRFLLKYTDRIICVCQSDYVKAVAAKVAHPAHTSVVHNGIEIEQFATPLDRDIARRRFGFGASEFIFGNVGRLHAQKGHAYLLRAFAKLNNPARLAIVGDGELRYESIGLADELKIDRRVMFLGARTDIYEFLSAIDVFVLPSLWEGQPIALLEALAIGKPCIASAVDGIPEIITNGVNGYLVAPRNIEQLTQTMDRAIEHPQPLTPFFGSSDLGSCRFLAQNMATEIGNLYRVGKKSA